MSSASEEFARSITNSVRANGSHSTLADHYAVDRDAKTGKPILPELPATDDPGAQSWWLTNVFNLDRAHAVTGAQYTGLSGGRGNVEISRDGAAHIHFEPATRLNKGTTLQESLSWQTIPTDGIPWPWSNAQCVTVVRIVNLLCAAGGKVSREQETESIATALMGQAQEVVGHIAGSPAERYEAIANLKPPEDGNGRPIGMRYLVDADTGEFVMRASDLLAVSRKMYGSLPHGWLDARMQELGWQRLRVQGYALPGRDGRAGPHLRCDVFIGRLSDLEEGDSNA